jgi:transcriptional regulator with XRE-family HTH domain
MKLAELKRRQEVLADHLEDRATRERWEKTALARAVALRLVAYRADHGLSQTALAKLLEMKQPAIARLESGETNPSWETLARLSHGLGLEFLIDIAPKGRRVLVGKRAGRAEVVEELTAAHHDVLIAVE